MSNIVAFEIPCGRFCYPAVETKDGWVPLSNGNENAPYCKYYEFKEKTYPDEDIMFCNYKNAAIPEEKCWSTKGQPKLLGKWLGITKICGINE